MRHAQRAIALLRRHPVSLTAARLGYVASAVLHLLVGWTALELVWTGTRAPSSSDGPLHQLVGTFVGRALLWSIAVGLGALALWHLTGAATRGPAPARLKHLGRTLVYLLLCATSAAVADGEPDDDLTVDEATAMLLEAPAGVALVGLLGVGVISMGIYHLTKGWRAGFLDDLGGTPGRWVVLAGRLGYGAKGVALAVAGGLLAAAAITQRSRSPQGMDAALHLLLQLPLGAALLVLMAFGFTGYALYAFMRARHTWVLTPQNSLSEHQAAVRRGAHHGSAARDSVARGVDCGSPRRV